MIIARRRQYRLNCDSTTRSKELRLEVALVEATRSYYNLYMHYYILNIPEIETLEPRIIAYHWFRSFPLYQVVKRIWNGWVCSCYGKLVIVKYLLLIPYPFLAPLPFLSVRKERLMVIINSMTSSCKDPEAKNEPGDMALILRIHVIMMDPVQSRCHRLWCTEWWEEGRYLEASSIGVNGIDSLCLPLQILSGRGRFYI